MERFWRVLLGGAAAVVLLATIVRVPLFWAIESYSDLASGVWFGLADDLTHGVFYRPVFSPDGFGGTRYFPVQIVVHAGMTKLFGGHLFVASQAITATAAFALLFGAFVVLRRVGLPKLVAASCAAMIPASMAVQEALLSFKGDLLPAAFSVWGVALCAAPSLGAGAAVGAGVLFALAFGTKLTAVSGAAAGCVYLWFSGQRRAAFIVFGSAVAGVAIIIAATLAASHGRVVDAWWAAASTGSGGLRETLLAPIAFAKAVRKIPETLVFVQFGIAAFLALAIGRRLRLDLTSWFFLFTLAVTIVIFKAEGTDKNHLLELQTASLMVAGAWLTSVKEDARTIGYATLAVAGLAASLSLINGALHRETESRFGTAREALTVAGDTSRPILAESAALPIAAGQRPYMLDPYMFNLLRKRNPTLTDAFFRDLDSQRFSAVILDRDPHTERGTATYADVFFGEGFVQRMEKSYVEAGRVKSRVIYRPKPR